MLVLISHDVDLSSDSLKILVKVEVGIKEVGVSMLEIFNFSSQVFSLEVSGSKGVIKAVSSGSEFQVSSDFSLVGSLLLNSFISVLFVQSFEVLNVSFEGQDGLLSFGNLVISVSKGHFLGVELGIQLLNGSLDLVNLLVNSLLVVFELSNDLFEFSISVVEFIDVSRDMVNLGQKISLFISGNADLSFKISFVFMEDVALVKGVLEFVF